MKRFIAIILVIALMVSMSASFAGCGGTAEYITRGAWIAALAERFGMDSPVAETDYFVDVNETSDYYNYVQSCGDWGVVSNTESNKFEPDKDATVEFALETAILASEVDIGDKSVVDYAIANGIIKDAGFMSVRGRLTPEVAQQIIDWTQDLYLNGTVEPRAIVEYKEEVQDLSQDVAIVDNGDGTYTMNAEAAKSLSRGDVVVMPDDEFVTGMGVKVDDVIENEDGTVTITTLDPEIEEILANLDIAGPVSWTMDDIQLDSGVSFSGGYSGMANSGQSGGVHLTRLENFNTDDVKVHNLANGVIPDINIQVNLNKGNVTINPEWDSLFGLGESFSLAGSDRQWAATDRGKDGVEKKTEYEKTSVIPVGSAYGNAAYKNQLAINEYKDGKISLDELKKALDLTEDQEEKNPKTMENKFKAGYEITGGLKISNIKVNVEAKYDIFKGVKAAVTLNYDTAVSLTLKGTLSESLRLMRIRVPITTGVTLDFDVYLCLDANGQLTISIQLANTTKYSLNYGSVKKSNSINGVDVSGAVACTIDFGPKFSIAISVVGKPLVDVGVKAVVRLKADANIHYKTQYTVAPNDNGMETITIDRRTYWGVGVNAYFPIITLEVNSGKDTIAKKLGLDAKWTLVGQDKAKTKEIVPMYENIIWQETIVFTDDVDPDEITPTEETTESEIRVGDFLDINTYFLAIEEGLNMTVTVTVIPEGYEASDLKWTSSNPAVATVSSGTITAVSDGIATVTVMTSDGKYYKQCSVTVTDADVAFTPIDDNLGVYA